MVLNRRNLMEWTRNFFSDVIRFGLESNHCINIWSKLSRLWLILRRKKWIFNGSSASCQSTLNMCARALARTLHGNGVCLCVLVRGRFPFNLIDYCVFRASSKKFVRLSDEMTLEYHSIARACARVYVFFFRWIKHRVVVKKSWRVKWSICIKCKQVGDGERPCGCALISMLSDDKLYVMSC